MNNKREIAYELHKPARLNYQRRRVKMKGLNDLYQSDLIEMIPYHRENGGYKYILITINTYSKYAFARPLKNKTGKEVASAMDDILNSVKTSPKNLQTDMGTEYYNMHFKAVMKKYGINHYSTYSNVKACIAERFIRTLKNNMYREFSARGSYKWIDILPQLIRTYNNTVHSTIKMKPNQVKDNSLLKTVYRYKESYVKPRFAKGDFVRVSKQRKTFNKGYLPSWSTEIFKVKKIQSTYPPTYVLEDLDGSEIRGAFYNEELQKTKFPDFYLIEKVIRRKGDKALVKWLGFPSTKNSWIRTRDMTSD